MIAQLRQKWIFDIQVMRNSTLSATYPLTRMKLEIDLHAGRELFSLEIAWYSKYWSTRVTTPQLLNCSWMLAMVQKRLYHQQAKTHCPFPSDTNMYCQRYGAMEFGSLVRGMHCTHDFLPSLNWGVLLLKHVKHQSWEASLSDFINQSKLAALN